MIRNLIDLFFKQKPKWYKVFSSLSEASEKIPLNRAVAVDVEGKQICLIHNSKGFYGIENRCPHQEAPLHRGACEGDHYFVCPYHRLKIDIVNGHSENNKYAPIKTYPIKADAKGVFIGIE
ncbi:MAG TPA: Rieske 2Fe-2S domain-containing protein [Cytophagaceae bacterium]